MFYQHFIANQSSINLYFEGFCLADVNNWTKVEDGFWHFGFAGVLSGASRCFFAYAGWNLVFLNFSIKFKFCNNFLNQCMSNVHL